mgnify:CR=1 FL=1
MYYFLGELLRLESKPDCTGLGTQTTNRLLYYCVKKGKIHCFRCGVIKTNSTPDCNVIWTRSEAPCKDNINRLGALALFYNKISVSNKAIYITKSRSKLKER